MKLYPRSRLRNMSSSGVNPYNRDLYATNGFQLPVTNTNASVKWVLDSGGTLVQSPANTPAMPGMRLATTVAEGALLGPELAVNGGFDVNANWSNTPGWSISGGVTVKVAGVGNTQAQVGVAVIGKRYQIQFDIVSVTGSGFRAYAGASGATSNTVRRYSAEVVASATTVGITAVNTDTAGTVDNFSVKEVIPTWLPTASDGSLISPISRMLRTAQGSVAEYDETYPGLLVEPAGTNYLLATATPATQTTGSLAAGTYTLWIEGAGSAAVTAGTATIADNGTASAGSPNTFTVSVAGTVTVTVTDPVTFFQLEGGAFPTSKIPTTTAAVTRAADTISFPTPPWLLSHPNDFAVIGTVVPKQIATSSQFFLGLYKDSGNYFGVYHNSVSAQTRLIKRINNINEVVIAASPAAVLNLPLQYIVVQSSTAGCMLTIRLYNGAAWGEWSAWVGHTTSGAKANVIPHTAFYVGSQKEDAGHFYATYPMTRTLRIPTNLSAAALQAWLIAKAGA